MLFTATYYKLAFRKASQRVDKCPLPRWHAACLAQRPANAYKNNKEEPWEEHPFVLPQPHFSVTVRIANQLQVLTNFVLPSPSSLFIPVCATFVVTIPLVFLPFVHPQCLRILGYQAFCISHHPATAGYVQPISHVHDSTRCSSFHRRVFIRKSIVVLWGSWSTEPSFSELLLFFVFLSIHAKKTVRGKKKRMPPKWQQEPSVSLATSNHRT